MASMIVRKDKHRQKQATGASSILPIVLASREIANGLYQSTRMQNKGTENIARLIAVFNIVLSNRIPILVTNKLNEKIGAIEINVMRNMYKKLRISSDLSMLPPSLFICSFAFSSIGIVNYHR